MVLSTQSRSEKLSLNLLREDMQLGENRGGAHFE